MASTYLKIEQEDGSFLEFRKEKIKARWVKEFFKLEKEVAALGNKGKYAEALDLRVNFVVSLFNDKRLTPDVIYDGVDSDKIIEELDRISEDIVGKAEGDAVGEK